jgi:hypothetical protein
VRLDVEPATADVPSRDAVTVEEIVVEPSASQKQRNGEHEVARSKGETLHFDVSGPFDPASFNQIALRLRCPGEEEVKITLLRGGNGGKPVQLGDPLKKRVPPRKAAQTVTFDVPMLRRESLAIDTISVAFVASRKGSALLSLATRHRPWSDWLPDARKAAEMVAIGGEMRRAEGLSSRVPLRTSFASTGSGRSDSRTEARALREPGARRCSWSASRAPRGRLEREYELEADPSPPRAGSTRRSTSPFGAGKEVPAFSLRTASRKSRLRARRTVPARHARKRPWSCS